MSKWMHSALFAAASLAMATTAFAQAPVKIAYINSQKILAEAPGRAEAEATYNTEMATARTQLQRMDDSLKAMVASYEKEAPALDSARREVRGKTIRDTEAAFSQRASALNNQMQQRQADLARPLMDQVSHVLDEVRTSGGYAMIFDVGAQNSSLVSADKSLDITDTILARLKVLGPPKAAASTTPPATRQVGPATKPAGVTRPKP
ncbi:MAG: OmpH family outer membrane protein [Gemmatimonadota bacterium]|nr:OmpH family outer membrane protein [Gemmatimonadota bacterium]